MKPVLILDANQRSALAVTRSLGKKGVPVITADETLSSLAGSSRFSRTYFQHRSALYDSPAFLEDIKRICLENDIDIIFPMTELTSALLINHNDQLPDIKLPFADIETINKLADKCQLVGLAESLGVPIPASTQLAAGNQPDIDLDNMSYPLVLKPGLSWLEADGRWIHTTVKIADDVETARTVLSQDVAYNAHAYMLQQCVPGHGEGIFAIYDQGRPVAFFAHRRLREKPPRGGVSVLSESADADPVLKEYARQLLDHVKWHGVAMVEFKVDETGKAYLMEVNTRFWGSLQLAIDAGIDFPWLLYQISRSDDVSTIEHYRTGQRLRWLLGDLDSLYLTLRDKSFSFIDKVRAIFAFLVPRPFITRHEVNRLNDIKPFIWECKKYLSDLF